MCSLPAVSTITISELFFFETERPSKRTDEGSFKFSLHTRSTFALFDHTFNCSTAAALYVSAAIKVTEFPISLYIFANFATLVVLPVPLTPTTMTTTGFLLKIVGSCNFGSSLIKYFFTSNKKSPALNFLIISIILSTVS